MNPSTSRSSSEFYADLSDRFRSLWTFYQFLGGVFKHLGDDPLPYSYDFQALYRQIQELAPRPEMDLPPDAQRDLQRIEREMSRIRDRLADIEGEFAPSQLRRFFDHLKRQDEKILFALVKFYLLADNIEQDSLDKLDILLTRVAEASFEDDRIAPRDAEDLVPAFERLAAFADVTRLPESEEKPLIDAIRETRRQLKEVKDFQELLGSQILDRYRGLKQRLGMAYLHPPVLVEVVSCNIEAKNRFKQLYEDEEVRILEDTNRILEIERYLDRNPNIAHEALRSQLDVFRQSRARFDSGRKEGNVKREDVFDLRKSMQVIFNTFENQDGSSEPPPAQEEPVEEAPPEIIRTPSDVFAPEPVASPAPTPEPKPAPEPSPEHYEPTPLPPDPEPTPSIIGSDRPEAVRQDTLGALEEVDGPGVGEEEESAAQAVLNLFPPDPLIDAELRKIVFALELVVWVHSQERAVHANELRNLRLEPWEIDAYRNLTDDAFTAKTMHRDLQLFYLQAAALRVKIEEEITEIARLKQNGRADRLGDVLELAVQTIDRARRYDKRFQWFVDDLMFRGETEGLERLYRSHFRLLRAYASLWLDHHSAGGLTPL